MLTVLSGEASVFTLVCLTSFRLYGVFKPIRSKHIKVKYSVFWIVLLWSASFLLALLPFSKMLSSYMIAGMLISKSLYFFGDVVTWPEYQTFAKRVAYLKRNETSIASDNWCDINEILRTDYHDVSPQNKGYFGYYSTSSVCMLKFYRVTGDISPFNLTSSAVIMFNFISLFYIFLAYVNLTMLNKIFASYVCSAL